MFALFRTRLSLAKLPKPAALPGMLRRISATRRQRRALLRLDPALLRDIGVDSAAARAEARRPIWDVPRHWRQ